MTTVSFENSMAVQVKTDHICQACEREDIVVTAVKWCSECEESLCVECERFHKKAKSTRNHHIVDVKYVETFSTVVNPVCNKHHQMSLDLFCVEHDEMCCKQCMTEIHRSCEKLMPLEVASQNVRSSAMLNNTLQDLDNVVKSFDTLNITLDKEIMSVDNQMKFVFDSIQLWKKRLNEQIDKSIQQLEQEADKHCKEYKQKAEQQRGEISKNMAISEAQRENLKQIIEHGSENQVFLIAHKMKSIISHKEEFIDKLIKDVYSLNVKFCENVNIDFDKMAIGHISCETNLIETYFRFRKAQTAEDSFIKDSIKKLNFSSHLTLLKKTGGKITGIAITKDDDLVFCIQTENIVCCYSSEGQYRAMCKIEGQPFSLSVVDKMNEVVVTLPRNQNLQFINISSMISTRLVKCSFTPWGISSMNEKLAVGAKDAIHFFNTEGQFLYTTPVHIPTTDRTAICYLCPTITGNILVSCKNFYSINKNGEVEFVFNIDSFRANGICVDRNGCIYIATKNAVIRLSKDGEVLDKNVIVNSKMYGDCWALAYNKDFTKMYVATMDGANLTVFDFN